MFLKSLPLLIEIGIFKMLSDNLKLNLKVKIVVFADFLPMIYLTEILKKHPHEQKIHVEKASKPTTKNYGKPKTASFSRDRIGALPILCLGKKIGAPWMRFCPALG